MLGYSLLQKPEGSTYGIVLLNSKCEWIKTLANFPSPGPPSYKNGKIVLKPYTPRPECSILNSEQGIYGFSSEYKLWIVNSSGNILRIIQKDEPPNPVTSVERNFWIKKLEDNPRLSRSGLKYVYEIPEFKTYYDYIFSDNKDRIYVRRISTFPEEVMKFDLFNKEGYYLYKIIIPISTPAFIKILMDGYLYYGKMDEESGYVRIYRSKVKNWDQIKEGISN